jgi:hypothetical protein
MRSESTCGTTFKLRFEETKNSFLFPKGTKSLKGRRLNDTIIIQATSLDTLAKIQAKHFKKCFGQWYDHWACCIKSQGSCFEGDKTDQKVSVVRVKQIQSRKLFDHTTLVMYLSTRSPSYESD